TVYVADGTSIEQVEQIAQALENRTHGKASVVPPALALKRLADQLGDLGPTLQGLPENPLPASIEVTVPPEGRDPQMLKALAEKTRQLDGVTGVDYGEEAVERLTAISNALRWGGLIAFAIVVLT